MRLFVDILDLMANQPIELLLTENTGTILGSIDGSAIKFFLKNVPLQFLRTPNVILRKK
jgi:hypothetical protein